MVKEVLELNMILEFYIDAYYHIVNDLYNFFDGYRSKDPVVIRNHGGFELSFRFKLLS